MRRFLDAAGAAATASVSTAVSRQILGMATPGGRAKWTRINHRGKPVSLLAGPAALLGLLSGGQVNQRFGDRAAFTLAVTSAGCAGLADDLLEAEGYVINLRDTRPEQVARTKGLRGHLQALRQGRVTTGTLKIVGIGVGAGLAAACLPWQGKSAGAKVRQKFADAALIAGCANLVNLLDLRPGRALKASTLLSAPLLVTRAAPMAASVIATAATQLEADLDEQDMLGDAGANALGAGVGVALTRGLRPSVRNLVLVAVVGLNLASEKISFSQVIADNPVLRHLDEWGRQGDSK